MKVLAPVLGSIVGLVTLRLLARGVVSQQQLQAWLHPLGRLAPVVFVLFLAIRPLTLLPGQLFTAVGGLLFGTLWATVYSLVGSFLASLLIFVLARRLGNPLIRRRLGAHYGPLQRVARHYEFRFSCLACLNPLFPTDVAQAAAAAAGARFWPVALGTLLASVPGTLLTAQFGSAVGQGKTILTGLSAVGMVVSLVLGAWMGRQLLRDLQNRAPEAPLSGPAAPHAPGLPPPPG